MLLKLYTTPTQSFNPMSDRSDRKNKIVSPVSIADEAAGDSSANSNAWVSPKEHTLFQQERDESDRKHDWSGEGSLKRRRAAATLPTKRLKPFSGKFDSTNDVLIDNVLSVVVPSHAIAQKKEVQTKDEIARHEVRKEQNRRAAIISRGRKKVLLTELNNTVDAFSKANKRLKQQNEELEHLLKTAQECVGMLKEDFKEDDADQESEGTKNRTIQFFSKNIDERKASATTNHMGQGSTSSMSRTNRINFHLPPIGASMDAMMNFQVAASAQVEEAMKTISYSTESPYSKNTSSTKRDDHGNQGIRNSPLVTSSPSSNLNTALIAKRSFSTGAPLTSKIPEVMASRTLKQFVEKQVTTPLYSASADLPQQHGFGLESANSNNAHLAMLSGLLANTLQERSSHYATPLTRTDDLPFNFLQQTHQKLSQQIQASYTQVQSQQILLQQRNQAFLQLLLHYQYQQSDNQQQFTGSQGDKRENDS